jgi:predicted phosphodiesterase
MVDPGPENGGDGISHDEPGGEATQERPAGERPAGWWRRHGPTWGPRVRLVVFAVAGAVLAVVVAGRIGAQVGPFDTTFSVRPSIHGYSLVRLAPLGTIELDTHDWPLALDVRVDEIGVAAAERIADNPRSVERLGDEVAAEVRDALRQLALRCAAVAVVGGVLGAVAARLDWRSGLVGGAAGALLVAAVGGGTAATFDADAVAEPRYTGLLTMAPRAVGNIETVIDRYGEYRIQLSDLVGNVATLYLAGENLPTFSPDADTIRILHVSDVHLSPQAFDLMRQVSDQFGVDAIVDTGDLTDWGTRPETRFVDEIGRLDVPYVYVRGNHDSRRIESAVGRQPNAVVLDGDAATVAGLRFWGFGDPRYTPDKDAEAAAEPEKDRAEAVAPTVAEGVLEAAPPPVDVLLVHDERVAGDVGGLVPLVLSGHAHNPRQDVIEPAGEDDDRVEGTDDGTDTAVDGTGDDGSDDGAAGEALSDRRGIGEPTILLVEGSTGGAGLRGLQGDEPEPLAASVLYFDAETRRLLAYDRLTVKGLGESGATIDRHVVTTLAEEAEPGDRAAARR